MGITNFDVVQANAFVGPRPENNPFGTTWFVDGTNGSDAGSNTGKSPAKAFASIGYAISRSAAGDNFRIAPGTYTITTALVPLARQTFSAAVINPRYPTVSITGNIADLIQIDVSGTAWYGLEVLASGATADNLVDIADAAAVNGCWFHSCVLNGGDQTSVIGLNLNDATFAVTGLVVEQCLFRDLTGTQLNVGAKGMAYSLIRHNMFALDINSGTSIALADTTTLALGKGWEISQNTFLGFDSTGDEIAVTIAGTEDTTAAGAIKNNSFHYFAAAAITADKVSRGMTGNYLGAASGTGLTGVSVGT